MNLSANVLFHYTKQDALENILKHSCLLPSFCFEEFFLNNIYNAFYLPMICFCDIPLSNSEKHIKKYGDYGGIGFKKDWAEKKGITPVMYFHKYSAINDKNFQISTCSHFFQDVIHIDGEIIHSQEDLYNSFVFVNSFLKDIKCYDEREWRYVPDIKIKLKEKNELPKIEPVEKGR